MEDIEEDKVANKILESLPPPFMVFGKQREPNPLEDFWMNKLTNIEKQYDLHIVELERKLLSEKATRRSIKKQTGKIAKLEESLGEKTTKLEEVTSTSHTLRGKLKEKEYEAKSLHQKLERSNTIQRNISKRMEDERKARIQFEKECTALKNKLKKMEKERAQLLLDVEIKESEKGRVEERESDLNMEKWTFIQHLTDVDTERRIQTNTNLRLCQDIEKLLGVDKSLEMGLLKERQVMGELMEEMKAQREEHKQVLRQLDLAIKEKRNVNEVLDNSLKKIKDKERDVLDCKEELRYKEGEESVKNQEIRDLKRRNSNIRCMLADTKQKLNNCLNEMQSLENEKRRAEVELENSKLHEKSLHLEMKKNELKKFKLAEKILKTHPFLMMNKKERESSMGSRRHSGTSSGMQNELESYKKQIWKLERSKDDYERRLRELQRKENVYRLKLDKYGAMEKQIFWTGKAMAKMEGDRQRLESMLSTMESNMPIRVPFKKLVTDPSVLDRLAKNKVLQKRLFRQTEKMEELKSNARRILQFREEEFGGMTQFPEEIPAWKLSYWNKQSLIPEGVLSGLNIDFEKQANKAGSLISMTDDTSYKKYLHYLDDEIPKLKNEIEQLERKKLCVEIERDNEEGRKKKAMEIAAERKRLAELLLDDERPIEGGAKGKAGAGRGREGESEDSRDGQMTAELSMHGSSFENAKKDGPQPIVGEEGEKRKLRKQTEHTAEHSSDGDASSEGASDIPTD